MDKKEIVNFFYDLSNSRGKGIEYFLSSNGKKEVFERLSIIDVNPLSKVQLNQLLIISGLPGITYGFYKYYWLETPLSHPYDVKKVDDYENWDAQEIISIKHLRWGIRRIYIDSLLYFGHIHNGYKILSTKKENDLITLYKAKNFPIELIRKRGKTLDFKEIPKQDRYLISEMACKTYEAKHKSVEDLKHFLIDNLIEAQKQGRKKIQIKELLAGIFLKNKSESNEMVFDFCAVDILDEFVENQKQIEEKYGEIAKRFLEAREKALQNTRYYLSVVNDLDVYVATSMRSKQDFIEMAQTCEHIFKNDKLRNYSLRYFDPTISAADCHEDKGLMECLMVKAARILIYSAGFKESYGKDAEAAMALSSGKPVVFYCPDISKVQFYKKVHPLTRLVDFSTGIANGAIITFDINEIVEILYRIIENKMEYFIEQPKKGYFRLLEKSTESVVRIQTNNELLTKSFWYYYDLFVNK